MDRAALFSILLVLLSLSSCATSTKEPLEMQGTITSGDLPGTSHCRETHINYVLRERSFTRLSAHYPPEGAIEDRTSLRVLQNAANNPAAIVGISGTRVKGIEPGCDYVRVKKARAVSR